MRIYSILQKQKSFVCRKVFASLKSHQLLSSDSPNNFCSVTRNKLVCVSNDSHLLSPVLWLNIVNQKSLEPFLKKLQKGKNCWTKVILPNVKFQLESCCIPFLAHIELKFRISLFCYLHYKTQIDKYTYIHNTPPKVFFVTFWVLGAICSKSDFHLLKTMFTFT